ncbi:MAG: outer membrane lipoprotein chaperone LolA [Gammaproteobacteria bacterium]|nr:outer membrane lipoprotein chaperone LolA [Gammaproteobacteria bacterium]
MKKVILSLLTLGFINTALADQTANANLTKLLENLKTFQAHFDQVIQDKRGTTMQESTGKMALQRPGRFRWETLTPNQQLIVADGKIIWVYDKDLQEVTKKKQTESASSPGLLLSASVGNLAKRYDVSALSKNDFKLAPFKHDLFKSVELLFDDNGTLTQMIMHDNIGQTTQIQFTHVSTNKSLSSSLFTFVPPKNIDVMQG